MAVKAVHVADNSSVQHTAERFDGTGSLYDTILEVTADIKNTGATTACETAQIVRPCAPLQCGTKADRGARST
jgi:hypothetical protein